MITHLILLKKFVFSDLIDPHPFINKYQFHRLLGSPLCHAGRHSLFRPHHKAYGDLMLRSVDPLKHRLAIHEDTEDSLHYSHIHCLLNLQYRRNHRTMQIIFIITNTIYLTDNYNTYFYNVQENGLGKYNLKRQHRINSTALLMHKSLHSWIVCRIACQSDYII